MALYPSVALWYAFIEIITAKSFSTANQKSNSVKDLDNYLSDKKLD